MSTSPAHGPIDRDRLLKLLQEGELTLEGLLLWSSNTTFLGVVQDGSQKVLVVYKPTRGERPLWDFPPGTLAKREVAAWLVSEALGWGLVPPTVYRKGPHGPGMVQLFIDHDPDEHFFTFRDQNPPELPYIAAFDVVVNNADRKAGHCLRDATGRIWCIDHGICFHVEPKLRTVIWDFAGQPLPRPIAADLERLRPALAPGGTLRRDLAPYLSGEEIEALRLRVEGLLRAGRYPHPGPGRHVPWPLV